MVMMVKRLLIALLILLLAGCAGGQPAKKTAYYMLNYTPPVFRSEKSLDDLLKLERFSVAQSFNNSAMAYRTGPFSLNSFPSDRWKANPGDLITDNLLRDFRRTGIFRAIFSYQDLEKTRFILQGSVLDFLGLQQNGDVQALLSLSVTLLDLEQKGISPQVVFQKNYSHASKCTEKGPEALAQGLSRSMEQLSEQIIADVYQALKSPHK